MLLRFLLSSLTSLSFIILFYTAVHPVKAQQTAKKATIYTTAKDTDKRLEQTGVATFEQGVQPLETELSIFVNPDVTFQTFVGIGGAITDASAQVFAKLPAEKQEELLNAYYTSDGIGYSLLRTHIHSCDFGTESYTYVEC